MSETEQELVQRCRLGDRPAFEELVRRYQSFVFSILYHYFGRDDCIEDLAQEVFLRFYESLDRFDTKRPIRHWIGRITANRCIDELRKRKRARVVLMGDLEEKEAARDLVALKPATGLTEEQSSRAWRLFQSLLNRLPASERAAFVLHEVEQMDYPDIARMLGTSQVAVRIRVSRARKKLIRCLEEMLDEP